MNKDSRSVSDWWDDHLAEYEADGRKDAAAGTYRPPCPDEDDPHYQDEIAAYRRGFDAKRRELGDAFKWS